GLRPDRGNRQQAAHHTDAGGLHVDPDLRRPRLREGRRDCDAPAHRHLGADHPLPRLHGALGATRMTTATATPVPVTATPRIRRRRTAEANALKYAALLF